MCIGYPPWSIRSYNLRLGLDQITNGRIDYKINCLYENLTNFSLFRVEELPLHQDQQPPHHQPPLHHQALQPHLRMVVDPHSGPMINGVMMRIIMQLATTMEAPVVELMSTKLIAQNVNVFKIQEVAVQVVQVRILFEISRL